MKVVTVVLGALLVAVSGACGSTPMRAAVTSPTPDSAARNYIALVHNFWIEEQAADEASNGSNVAARVCLGQYTPGAPSKLQLIDPPLCRERAVAILAGQQRFLSDLETTPPPPEFAADDQTFRTQLPKAISDLNTLISAAESGKRDAVLQAATAYNNDMFPAVTDALNDVDPSVAHP